MLNKPNIKPYIIGSKLPAGQNGIFEFRIFHFKPDHRGRAHGLGHFQTKINVFDVKAHFNCVIILENHKPLEFKSSTGQNGTFTWRMFSFHAK